MPAARALPRKDSFFGLHFDLHPGKNDTELGAHLTEGMVKGLLERVKPDYVQYDCKGHAGYAGYETKVGWPSPGIVGDSLAIWRKATRESGVALYVHYSGVWDSVAVEKHPEWARVDPAGEPDKNATSTFGPYCEELLIPQLKEAIDRYDLDGVWVDGDCWAVKPDFSDAARSAFTDETGITEIPGGPEEPGWQGFLDFNRKAFVAYVGKYADALHAHKPGFQVASNWMYSTLAPFPVELPLDYISGDYSPTDSVNRARLEARYMAATGMPWDLMAWGFNKGRDCASSAKTPTQLKQEASIVLSQGGGFQVYYNPTRAGWIDDWMIGIMADLAGFCRRRQSLSHKTRTIPQVALLLSETSLVDGSDRLFGPWGELESPIQGALHALLELGYSVDVLAEHHLVRRAEDYPLIVLPECHLIRDDLRARLVERVRNGGSLLAIGAETARIFEGSLGVTFTGEEVPQAYVRGGDVLAWMGGPWQAVDLTTAKVLAPGYTSPDTRQKGIRAVTTDRLGRGRIAGMYGPFGTVYHRSHNTVARRLLGEVVQELFPSPMVALDAPPCVDVSLRRKEGAILVHLTNVAGMQVAQDHTVIDHIPPVGPVVIEVALDEEPRGIHIEPTQTVSTDWSDGRLRVILESVDIHSVLAIYPQPGSQ
jgi:hypothetical protein